MILSGGFSIDVFVKLSSVLLRLIEKKSPGSLGKHAMWNLKSDLNYLFIVVIVQLKNGLVSRIWSLLQIHFDQDNASAKPCQ